MIHRKTGLPSAFLIINSSCAKSIRGMSTGRSSARIRSPILWYSSKLETHPLTTKCLSSGFIAASGDLFCQNIVFQLNKDEKEKFQWDMLRTGRFGLLGFGLFAPIAHAWYGLLMTRFPGTSVQVVAKRTFLDQALFAPLFLPTFVLSLSVLEGTSPEQTLEKLRVNLWPMLKTNWGLWIPAQVVNFGLVPSKYQVLFSNLVGFIWNAYLSWRTQERHSREKEEEA